MMVAALKPADRLRAIGLTVDATHPDAVIVCAEPPVQAAVAAVAAARDLPLVCMPAGPDDLLARDLGMPLDDPAEALELPFSHQEQAIDLGEVNGLPFVNHVALGVELPVPVPRSRRGGRRRTDRSVAAGERQTGRGATPEDLPALLVCNNRFELLADQLGQRDWPDSGRLEVVTFAAAGGDRSYAALRKSGFQERSCGRFQLTPRSAVLATVDGEPCRLTSPLRFRSVAAAVRVRAPGAARRAGGAPAGHDSELESLQTG